MKFTSSVLFAAAAIGGVSARPSIHHAHQNAHRSIDARDVVKAVKPDVPVPTTDDVSVKNVAGDAPKAPKAPKPFCNGQKTKRATLDQIMYAGNTGSKDNYGCNVMVVDEAVVDSYDYTIKLQNAGDKDQECVAYLKVGADGGINGFFKNNEALKFKLPAKGKTHVAVDINTQGGIICQAGEIETTGFGQYASTWFEFDMANESNNGWSGADVSCLAAASQGMTIPGMKACHSGICSTVNPGGSGDNAFLGGMEALDGLGMNIPAGPVSIDVIVDYPGN